MPGANNDVERSLVATLAGARAAAAPVRHAADSRSATRFGCMLASSASAPCWWWKARQAGRGIFASATLLMRLKVAGQQSWLRPTRPRPFMTPNPETGTATTRSPSLCTSMDGGGYRHLPITKGGKVTGIISVRDILRYITDDLLRAEA